MMKTKIKNQKYKKRIIENKKTYKRGMRVKAYISLLLLVAALISIIISESESRIYASPGEGNMDQNKSVLFVLMIGIFITVFVIVAFMYKEYNNYSKNQVNLDGVYVKIKS